jgi:hypothetical protein
VTSLFLAGVATLAVSHLSRSEVEGKYAAAIQLADAGINYELRWVSEDTSDPNRPHQAFPANGQPGPYTGSVPGVTGSFTVRVMNTNGTGPWYAPNDVHIVSTGTVGGVSRTVRITGQKRGIFDEYLLYSTQGTTVHGSGSLINGNFGTNGDFIVNGGLGSSVVNGTITFNGVQPTVFGSNVYTTNAPMPWPTVAEIANAMFPQGGLTWLRTHNSNGNLKQFSPSDSTYSVANAVNANLTLTNYRLRAQDHNSLTVDQHPDDAAGGSRYANAFEGLKGRNVLIFPPGDYYLSEISYSNSSKPGWLIDTASGTVRIWVDGSTANDSIDLPVVFTSTDVKRFRLFYNKCTTLSVQGNSEWYGAVYAVVEGCLNTVVIGGNSSFNGSLIGTQITMNGNSVLNFPNNGGGSTEDFALWFGFQNTWKEINPNGSAVFVDGSAN